MPPRVTRSTARLNTTSTSSSPNPPPPLPQPPSTTRKRKAAQRDISPEIHSPSQDPSIKRRAKRTKTDPESTEALEPPKTKRKSKAAPAMSNTGTTSGPSDEQSISTPAAPSPSSRRKPSHRKSGAGDTTVASSSTALGRAPKRLSKSGRNTTSKETPQRKNSHIENSEDAAVNDSTSEDSENEPLRERYEEMEDEDDFARSPWSEGGRPSRIEAAMRSIHNTITRTMTDLRSILEQLRQKDEPTLQRCALEELAQILLMANEDTLAGHFSPDPYLKEIIPIMDGEGPGAGNPEMMLLACRCIANMMEALPASTSNVVFCGAVPILCEKLREIEYIDLAEQSLSTLEKISVEFPGAIVRAHGLEACLQYLDFFAISTQRSAVTTAANCCRNISDEHFGVVKSVMPILLNVLSNNDQKVLEQGCLCVSRIVESFKFHDNKLEELVSEDLLKAILRLLLPGTTNLINSKIHTSFLRVLAFTSRASPKLSVALIKMNVVDTLFQILSGVSPPSGDGELSSKIDKVMIMQSLIHRPRDQIFETLNVICELLPSVSVEGLHYMDGLFDAGFPGPELISMVQESRKDKTIDTRINLMDKCKTELRRFIIVLLPTLTDAYSSTVNLSVRQKVLTAQLKMLSNIDVNILQEALNSVSYPSFLASILSQGDHPSLVSYALQAAEVLLKRLENVYRYQFYREGVFSEIARLAARPLIVPETPPLASKDGEQQDSTTTTAQNPTESARVNSSSNSIISDVIGDMEMEFHDGHDEDDMDEDDEDDDEENEDNDENDENDENDSGGENDPEHPDYDHDGSESTDSDSESDRIPVSQFDQKNPEDLITKRAKAFIELYDSNITDDMRIKAATTLERLQNLTKEISEFYSKKNRGDGVTYFQKLASYFGQDALSSVTSYELLSSKIVAVLLDVFSEKNARATDARSTFLHAFMSQDSQGKETQGNYISAEAPFSVIVHKLQDLLSRAEHFEVMTANNSTYDGGRGSPANMLAKQIRIRLVADEDSGVTGPLRDTIVTVHALATMKSIGDFLRPRLSLPERPSRLRRDGLPPNIAAYAAALAQRGDRGSFFAPAIPTPSDVTNRTLAKRSHGEKPPISEQLTTRRVSGSSNIASPSATTGLRRSRRHQGQPPPPPSLLPPPNKEGDETIECADEKQITDSDSIDEENALNAIVGRLDQEMESDAEEPSAVNLEVAPTGKVTARKEDGTRVATPVSSQQTPATGSRSVSAPRASSSLIRNAASQTPSRAMSYAAAMAATPQDWHLEFSINDQPIGPDTTLYRVVHFSRPTANNSPLGRGLLSNTHTIKFRKVPGPPPAESTTLTQALDITRPMQAGIPVSLTDNPTTAAILQLLSILHGLNSNIDDVLQDNKDGEKLVAEPLSQFVNTKLTAKLNRQLEEPLIVASGCLPSWSEDLPRHYPFLFPFETRHLFLQSTSFGFARSMSRWQNDQTNDSRMRDERQFLGRLQRQKVRISRGKILESALKVMDLYGSSPAILEVEFFDEVGTGLGPTLEFYSIVSKEFAKKRLKLWRENESEASSEYSFGTRGLFPAPMSEESASSENGKKLLSLFKTLGKFVARSMLDCRIIDIAFNPVFFRIGTGTSASTVTPSLGAVETVDENLARSLRPLKKAAMAMKKVEEDESLTAEQKAAEIQNITVSGVNIEDLSLDFTLPGYPDISLKPDGANISVTIENLGEYVDKVLDFTLASGVRRQVEAFQSGFSLVFPYAATQAFTPDELVMLFGRVEEDWTLETLMDSIKADHGYNLDSKSVRNLLQIMASLSSQERREFLQFVTGSPKLPIGGFKALTPMFTVVCKPSEAPYTSNDYLPSVMTCVNYLKLPDYSNMDIMRKKLDVAIKEGQGAFHLS